jgi:Toprim domain
MSSTSLAAPPRFAVGHGEHGLHYRNLACNDRGSLRCVMPALAMAAALSAAHLAAILFPVTLRRLYIVRDDDRAGDGAMNGLIDRARVAGIEAIVLSPQCGDFNEDLQCLGINALRAALRIQIIPEDATRFLGTSVRSRAGDKVRTSP